MTDSGSLGSLFTDDQGISNLTFTVDGKTVAQGTYGTLQLVDGKYVYTLNNADAAVQGLDSKNGGKDTFVITAKDEYGVTRNVTITVNVSGTDDAPTLMVGNVITVREGDTTTFEGVAKGFDSDTVDQGHLSYSFGTDADGSQDCRSRMTTERLRSIRLPENIRSRWTTIPIPSERWHPVNCTKSPRESR